MVFLKGEPQIKKLHEGAQNSLSIEIDSNKIYDEISLQKWLTDFFETVFNVQGCTFERIDFVASLSEESFYQGMLLKSDFDLFKRGKVSQAEWVKRFNVKRMDTVASMKASLKKAREDHDIDVALKQVDRLLENDSENFNWRLIRANILLDQGNAFDASGIYQELLKESPQNLVAQYNLACAKKHMGSFAEAIDLFQKVIEVMKNAQAQLPGISLDDVRLQIADAAFKNNQISLSGQYLSEVQSQTKQSRLIKANQLRAEQKPVEAKIILQQMIDADEFQNIALYDLVLVNLDMKDAAAARIAYEELKKQDSGLANELAFLQVLNPNAITTKVDSDDVTDTMTVNATSVIQIGADSTVNGVGHADGTASDFIDEDESDDSKF